MKIVKKHFLMVVFILIGSTILATSCIKASLYPFSKRSISDRQVTIWQKPDALKNFQLFSLKL